MSLKFLIAAAVLVLGFSAVATTPAMAKGPKPGGGGSTASIKLDQTDPHLGDWVTFTASGGSRISVACYQGGVGDMVYSADQAVGTAFLLGGTTSTWKTTGGSALCYAWLYQRNLSSGASASTSFTAAGAR